MTGAFESCRQKFRVWFGFGRNGTSHFLPITEPIPLQSPLERRNVGAKERLRRPKSIFRCGGGYSLCGFSKRIFAFTNRHDDLVDKLSSHPHRDACKGGIQSQVYVNFCNLEHVDSTCECKN